MAAIEVVLGDITDERTDAIVTAANESLLGGGGVDGAIHRAAGPRLAEAGAAIAPCDAGDAKATPGFDLGPPIAHVIHTVGPVWEGGGRGEADVLASCYRRCLQVADALGVRSIAFPAIATGVYGFPAEKAARIAVSTLASTPTAVQRIRLVAFDEATRDLLANELSARAGDEDSVLIAELDVRSESWPRLLVLADDFAARPRIEDDCHWRRAQERPDGVIVLGFPIYGERVDELIDVLHGVGAVTPEYDWMHSRPLKPPSEATLSPADAIRSATATLRGERFCDGTIAAALERGTLQAVLASLAAWYRARGR